MKQLLLVLMLCLALPAMAQDPEYDDIIKPTFKGGDLNRFRAWIVNRMHLTPDQLVNDTLRVSFVVGKAGKLEDITLIRGVEPYIDKHVMGILKYSPKWKPGIKDGQPVRVKYTLPIVFRKSGGDSPSSQTTGYEQRVGRRPYSTGNQEQDMPHSPLSTRHGGLGHH
ncbi:MAG: energy transducer TonB [Alistipes sp.]|nr:energy transducer TonB [Alistipes sp.]